MCAVSHAGEPDPSRNEALLRRLRERETLLVTHPDDNVEPFAVRNAADVTLDRGLWKFFVPHALAFTTMGLIPAQAASLTALDAVLVYGALFAAPLLILCALVPWGMRVTARDTLDRVNFETALEVNLTYNEFVHEVGMFNSSWGRESKARAQYLNRAWMLAQRIADGSWEPASAPVSSCVVPTLPSA